eukprot:COSAG05_NODE_8271_length_719_cov_1.791935_1_plen_166_part_10
MACENKRSLGTHSYFSAHGHTPAPPHTHTTHAEIAISAVHELERTIVKYIRSCDCVKMRTAHNQQFFVGAANTARPRCTPGLICWKIDFLPPAASCRSIYVTPTLLRSTNYNYLTAMCPNKRSLWGGRVRWQHLPRSARWIQTQQRYRANIFAGEVPDGINFVVND